MGEDEIYEPKRITETYGPRRNTEIKEDDKPEDLMLQNLRPQ